MYQSQDSSKTLEYDNQLNKRLENRNMPSALLEPLFDIRPLATKYTMFHTVDPKIKSTSSGSYQYDPYQIFNPGYRAPVEYYIRHVDVESTLRSQFFALQTSPQAVYVPELNSQLYENHMVYSNPSDSYSTTDAKTQCSQQSQDEFENQSVFHNCIRTNSKK